MYPVMEDSSHKLVDYIKGLINSGHAAIASKNV